MTGWEINRVAADGSLRAWTSYTDEGPLATVVPFKKPLIHPRLEPGAPVRLSRFAYLHRRGRVMLLQTPLTGVDMELHHPWAGAMLSAMSFDISAEQLAQRVSVPVGVATEFLNQLVAMSVAFPVAHERDPYLALNSLAEWTLEQGLPSGWNAEQLLETLRSLPWERVSDYAELILELHHDDARRVDVSVTIHVPRQRAALSDLCGQEFDVTADGPQLMGTFDGVRSVPMGVDPADWIQRAIDEAARDLGQSPALRIETNEPVRALVTNLGIPTYIGTMARREGMRLLFEIKTRADLAAIQETLRSVGTPDSVLSRLEFLEPLLNPTLPIRLAVDAVGESLAADIGIEIFIDPQIRVVLPGVLDALGLDSRVLDEVLSIVQEDVQLRDVMLVPGVVTDSQATRPMHVKVAFDAAGNVTAKTYISVSSTPITAVGQTEEDRLVPSTWEFHDLLFHSQTRDGRVRHRLGSTDRFSLAETTLVKEIPPPPGDVALPPVDVAASVQADAPFGAVMRERVSVRDWTGPELPVSALAELLIRVQELIARTQDFAGTDLAWSGAPYPSGGGVYETDIVVIAHRVDGLEPGAYLYRRASASLKPLHGNPEKCEELLLGAANACGTGIIRPQALLVFAARFPDLAVKYEGLAYSLMVKHVGVLMASVAYTATAMGLGSVPLGTGNSDVFAAATGLDYYRHGSIGEIAICPVPS